MQSDNMISIGATNVDHINSYIQYCNLVGDNGGKLLSEKQYEDYKKNYAKLSANRLYTNWQNSKGLACKVVGPSTKCFCDHYYKNHDFLQAKDGKLKCKTEGCKCKNYTYIPIYGSQDFKCTCKHSYQQHDLNKKNCKSCICKEFRSNWNCSCGAKYSQHKTISESKQQKNLKGQNYHPKQGGIVSYSSMLDGEDRFESDIRKQVNKKGIKVSIEEFVIKKNYKAKQDKMTAWQLFQQPIQWLK